MAEPSRRKLLSRLVAGAGAFAMGGCTKLSQTQWVPKILRSAEDLDLSLQHLLAGRYVLAPEYSNADIAPVFRPNGTLYPQGKTYAAHVKNGFRDWQIKVGGLVERPFVLSLAQLKAYPPQSQITRHDCVEGWSCIGEWTGAPLHLILDKAGVKPAARFAVFYCADNMADPDDDPQLYYESLDLIEAYHPQTILAYGLNGGPLPIPNGAPVRLRAERQLGYKMAKYVNGIELVADFRHISGGNGGYWEDQGYNWWAGI